MSVLNKKNYLELFNFNSLFTKDQFTGIYGSKSVYAIIHKKQSRITCTGGVRMMEKVKFIQYNRLLKLVSGRTDIEHFLNKP